jgi:hypothetical protein
MEKIGALGCVWCGASWLALYLASCIWILILNTQNLDTKKKKKKKKKKINMRL